MSFVHLVVHEAFPTAAAAFQVSQQPSSDSALLEHSPDGLSFYGRMTALTTALKILAKST